MGIWVGIIFIFSGISTNFGRMKRIPLRNDIPTMQKGSRSITEQEPG